MNMSLTKCILVLFYFTIYDDFTTYLSKTALSFNIWKTLCLSTQQNNATWFFAIRFILFLSCSWHIIKWSPQSALVYLTNIQARISLQVHNHEIVVNIFHISHNLTWYSAIVHGFTRIYPVCSTYELTKQFM